MLWEFRKISAGSLNARRWPNILNYYNKLKEFQKHFWRHGIKFLACFRGKICDGVSTVSLKLS